MGKCDRKKNALHAFSNVLHLQLQYVNPAKPNESLTMANEIVVY